MLVVSWLPILYMYSSWVTAGFNELSGEAKCLVCCTGEECERESSFERGTPAVLEIERGVLGGWLLCWYVSVTVSMGVSYALRSAWIDVIFCATVG